MGIFIKSGILHTLKFHLHTLNCHFWLNLWPQVIACCLTAPRAVFDIAQILAYLVHNMSRSQLYLGFGHFGWPGLGSNTFFQIQIQIQKFGFFKYKYKYKYFLQPWFKYKYKYIHSNTNTNTNTFNQIYLPKLFRIQNREILQIPRCMLMACVSLCLGDTWSLPLCISGNFTGTRAVGVGWG